MKKLVFVSICCALGLSLFASDADLTKKDSNISQKVEKVSDTPVEDYEKEKKEENEKLVKAFPDILKSADISAYSKGIDVTIETTKAINKKEFKKLAKAVANKVREIRGVTGKVKVYAKVGKKGKEISAKF